jgi:hypothetical protein
MTKYILAFILVGFVAVSCDKRPTNTSPEESRGDLHLHFSDSFHISDSTYIPQANVDYHISHPGGYFENGIFAFPESSALGDTFTAILSSIPAGQYSVVIDVTRPFIILGRKDNTSDARFSDSLFVAVPANYFSDAPQIDIWAYRLNRLVVYFGQDITIPQADSIVSSLGGVVLTRAHSLFNNTLFYKIATDEIANEDQVKPIFEAQPGVNSVFFDNIGHSYF